MKIHDLLTESNNIFYLPPTVIEFYDDPTGVGDDGWDYESLKKSIKELGIQEPLEVARSQAQMDAGDDAIYAFNGNHRLKIAKALKLPLVPCVHSGIWSEDAVPILDVDIIALGGRR